jgi:hypothetical protein
MTHFHVVVLPYLWDDLPERPMPRWAEHGRDEIPCRDNRQANELARAVMASGRFEEAIVRLTVDVR